MTATPWLPRFACPACGVTLDGRTDAGDLACARCRRAYPERDGIRRFLLPDAEARLAAFAGPYRIVRARDGYRSSSPAYYRRLPAVAPDDPEAASWQVRQQSFLALLRHGVPAQGACSLAVLDAGAGSGWLCHRLAQQGHRPVALDWLDDAEDGLGARRHYPVSFACVQGDLDAPPFADAQFDLVIFNGSLHYAPDARATLARARRLLAPGGRMAVVDSPLFRRAGDGRAMLAEKLAAFRNRYGVTGTVESGAGFVTFAELGATARALGLRARFYPSRGRFGWRVRRLLGGLRRRRAPAGFGLWVAR